MKNVAQIRLVAFKRGEQPTNNRECANYAEFEIKQGRDKKRLTIRRDHFEGHPILGDWESLPITI